MSENSLREAIKEVVNEVLATNKEITFKPWIMPNENDILKIDNPMKEEELKNVAMLKLKSEPFYCDWGTNVNMPKTTIDAKGIEVNKSNGSMKYEICLKDNTILISEVKESEHAGIVWEGLISYGDINVSLDEFKYAKPIKTNTEKIIIHNTKGNKVFKITENRHLIITK